MNSNPERKAPDPRAFIEFIADHRNAVYERITRYLPIGAPEAHHRMVRDYVERKGQYRRPGLILLWSALHGGEVSDALLPAAAMQLSEDWILMHDDWEDGNELRRGEQAAHVRYGDRYAINAGDHLHAISWRVAKDACDALGAERGNRYFDKFFDIIAVTHQGQYLDMRLTHEVRALTAFSEEDYFASIRAKAAYYSVSGPMQLGAIVARAPSESLRAIEGYGELAGCAFQMRDDILDCTATAAVLGKTPGNDILDGTKTWLLWFAVQHAPERMRQRLAEVYAKPRAAKTAEDVAWVLRVFHELGAIHAAEEKVEEFRERAIERFERAAAALPESTLKDIARSAICATMQRTH